MKGESKGNRLYIPAIPKHMSLGHVEGKQWVVDGGAIIRLNPAVPEEVVVKIFADHGEERVGQAITLQDVMNMSVGDYAVPEIATNDPDCSLIVSGCRQLFVRTLTKLVNDLGLNGRTQFIWLTCEGHDEQDHPYREFQVVEIKNLTWNKLLWDITLQLFRVYI